MNADIKARWVAALRSGEYQQTSERLQQIRQAGGSAAGRRVGFCCLGVLCDLAEKDGVISPPTVLEDGSVLYSGEGSVLPERVGSWAGLIELNPYVYVVGALAEAGVEGPGEHEDQTTLAEVNDSGASFAEISTLIEEQL